MKLSIQHAVLAKNIFICPKNMKENKKFSRKGKPGDTLPTRSALQEMLREFVRLKGKDTSGKLGFGVIN